MIVEPHQAGIFSSPEEVYVVMTAAVIYARVSSKEQEQEGYSIPAQLSLLRGYALERGFTIAREFVDVETAKHAGRPGFEQMLSYIVSEDACNVILVEKTDRLYRNLRDYVTLDEMKPEIHFVKENFIFSENSHSSERFLHGIKVLMARNYIDNLSEETRKGMLEKARQGTWPSAAPAGYVNVEVGDRRRLALEPDRAPIIAEMFRRYATGDHSLTALADWALAQGYRGPRGGKLKKGAVAGILHNIFYTGRFLWKDVEYQGDHDPLVSMEVFQTVQGVLAEHGPEAMQKREFAYSGLVTCAHCGCKLTAEIKKRKYVYYHCTGNKGACPKPYIREEDLEGLLLEVLQAVRIDDEVLAWIRTALIDSSHDQAEYHHSQLALLRRRHTVLQNNIEGAYEDKLQGHISEDFWAQKSADWREEQHQLLAKIELHQKADEDYTEAGCRVLRLASGVSELWEGRSPKSRRELLNIVQSNLLFDGTSLTATYSKPFCWLAEGQESSFWLPILDDIRNWFCSQSFAMLARRIA